MNDLELHGTAVDPIEEESSLEEAVFDSIEVLISERLAEARELLGAEDDARVFMIDHPQDPGRTRLYGVASDGKDQHAVFFVRLGFVPNEPNMLFYFSDVELRQGNPTGPTSKIITE